MPKPVEEYRIITCGYRGFIYQLGQAGPIVHPVSVPYNKVRSLVSMGAEVYEHDLATGNSILLTLENIADPNRWVNDAANPPSPVVKPGVTKLPEKVEIDSHAEESTKSDPEVSDEIPEASETSEEAHVTEDVDPNAGLYNNPNITVEDFMSQFQIPMTDDGKVDESKIRWDQLSNKKKRALREKVSAMNVEA